MNEAVHAVPEGFEPMQGSGFIPSIGGIYINRARRAMGVRIQSQHLNPLGSAHGGLLATLIDTAFGMAIRLAVQSELPPLTVSLNIEYLSPAPPGAWLEATVEVQKIGARIVNASCLLKHDDHLIAKGNAIFMGASGVLRSKRETT